MTDSTRRAANRRNNQSGGMAIRKALAAPMRGFGIVRKSKRPPITDADVDRAIEEARDAEGD